MNDHPVHVAAATDAERFLATDHTVWFDEVPAAPAEEQLLGLPADRRFAAYVDGADPASYPGVYAAYPMELSVPGDRRVPVSGLTWVGVHPDHRRRGILSAMMRHHLEQVHAEPGVHLSALHASEPGIYGRFGYGLASLALDVTLGRGTALAAPHLEAAAAGLTTRLETVSDAGVAERIRACHLASAELGTVTGEPEFYERLCREFPEQMRGQERWRVLFAREGDAEVGFAMFRRSQKWERARPSGELSVWTVVGSPAARLALVRRLVDFDLVVDVKLRAVGAEDPLLHWVGGPRATSDVATHDNLWLRLVDLPEALAGRGWSETCDVVVDVADRHAPWNHGSWHLRVAPDGVAHVERTTREADLRLPVEALGAAYLGGRSLVGMLTAGLVAERRPGAVAELWRAMRTPVAPTAAWMF